MCFRVDGGHRLGEMGIELGFEGLELLQAVLGGCVDGVGLGRQKSAQRGRRIAREDAGAWVRISVVRLGRCWREP